MGYPRFRFFFYFFLIFNRGISFVISSLSSLFFFILFAFDAWLSYPDRGFASQMFLQIKDT